MYSSFQQHRWQDRNSSRRPPHHLHLPQSIQRRRGQEQRCRDPSKTRQRRCANDRCSNDPYFALGEVLICGGYQKTTCRMKILMPRSCLSKNLGYQANHSKTLMRHLLNGPRPSSCLSLSFHAQEVLPSRRHLTSRHHPETHYVIGHLFR